jgi:E1A/CREB-binding protein
VYVSGCRALGLIDKVVTGPIWRKLEESHVSILDMSCFYSNMKAKFDSWSADSRSFVEGTACLHEESSIHSDEVWNALVESNVTDTMTIEALQIIFSSFSITTQKLLLDHLPGGTFSDFDEELQTEVSSVTTANAAPERDFARLDRMIREKPNANLVALEAMILYSHNKTSIWLQQQTAEDIEKLLKAVQTLAPTIKTKFKERREIIETRREALLLKKQAELSRKNMQTVKEKEMLTKEIEKIHLWTTRDDVVNSLAQISKKSDKIQALKLQIKFRDKVLNQTNIDRSVFKFSHQGKAYSINQLTENLCQLFEETSSFTAPSLEQVSMQPEVLVGKRIKHQFEVDEKLIWYDGVVMKLVDKARKMFEVVYDEENEEVYHFTLLDDIATGDLLILTDN